MFNNGLAFFPNEQSCSLKLLDSFYKSNDYFINPCFTDGEFSCLKSMNEVITLDTSAKHGHVGDIERVVWTVKDKIFATWGGLPVHILPYRMIIKIVAFALMWLNSPPRREVSLPHIAHVTLSLAPS